MAGAVNGSCHTTSGNTYGDMEKQSEVPRIDDKPKIRLFLDFPTKRGPIRIPDRIGNKYSDYGIFLLADDTGSRVDAIKSKHQLDYNSIIEEITREWLEGSGVKPVTWRTLVQVLKQIRLVTLAQEIEEAFQN